MSVASLLKKEDSSAENIFGAFVCDDETTQALVPVLTERGWNPAGIKTGGIESAIRTLSTLPSPQFLVVDISKSADPMDDLTSLAEVVEPGTMVITLGNTNDITLYRELISYGIHDYLVKPVTADQLRDTISSAEHAARIPEETTVAATAEDTDKLVAVVGVRGGVGTSTVATSMAWILAHDKKRPTALLDMDIYFGTGALSFDLEPGRGLCDALENPSRVDGLFIERAMIKESDNLSILGSEAPLNDPTYTDPAALSHLLTELKNNFKYVVLDLPKNTVADYPLLLSEADEIILVSDLSLAATRDTIRFLAFCKTVAPEADVKVLLNKVAGPGQVEVEKKDFEASIERAVDWEIPLDSKLMIQVSKSGKPLPQAAKHSKPVKTLNLICDDLLGNSETEASVPFWKKFAQNKKEASKKK
ncbi:AAA family ATPase [Emcibacter nanhaiensis]|uniref:Pilus assembly protein CpaE n=1 Tax=Emcibacter nanhaiensis TaxID=1505037 RepID=A0A501PBD6_9PROT|nr:AAA family ATPase [Emcibacter nanhaiensis]TPD57719.1 pilus assembly protein CpaE [Emcibacter nanhaiensis]